jgi:hypothetical protein
VELDEKVMVVEHLGRPLRRRAISMMRVSASRAVADLFTKPRRSTMRRWWLSTHMARRRRVEKLTTAALVLTPTPSN